jgi:N-acetylmuramoyl-L-alanine amidase
MRAVLRRTALALPFALGVILSLSPPLLSQQATLTILSKDALNNTARRTIATTTVNDQEYVALDDLAAMFQLTVREDAIGGLAVNYKGKTILLMPDQPLASVSGRVVALPAAPIRSAARRWLVPVDFIGRAFPLVYDAKITVRRPSRLVIVGDLRVPRVQVRYDAAGTGGRLTIDATPRAASTVSQDGDQLTVKFDADAIDAANIAGASMPGATGLIQNIRVADAVTLAFTVGPRFGAFKVAGQPSDTSMRQTIDIAAAATAQVPDAAPAPSPFPTPPPDLSALSPLLASGPSIRTVAIDPGHGGDDDGAKGAAGTKEKDVTLAVARKLKAALESKLGVRVLLTRDDDRSVAIDDRTAVANNGKADLFISLHANASWRPTLAGATILTAHFEHQTEQAARALASELMPAFGDTTRDIEFVPWDVAQIPHLEQSAMLARLIGEQLHDHVPLAMKPVDAAPLRVLEPANMPAVLLEMGYLTNPDQEKRLADPDFQNALVQALVDAVVKFREAMGHDRRAVPPR